MDNPKIIKVPAGSVISNGNSVNFTIKHNQNFVVIAETETHFFFNFRNRKYSILKNLIKHVTFKNRTIKFSDLKKNEILNTFSNYRLLIDKAQRISAELSKYNIGCYNMTEYYFDKISVLFSKDHIQLLHYVEIDGKIKIIKAEIPMKYLWDKNWRKTILKEYDK